ncbi:unnamed protein product [Rotaria sordida]|uniref:Uncharacterized protein n=1 Tax=Rotaria sordida TaxID=392033 RepID=A0A818TZ09_9BILA|nr:unnamed protein product [Rotaria sordida]CAF3690804.1 unnamed protein product [Rotaria sordida]
MTNIGLVIAIEYCSNCYSVFFCVKYILKQLPQNLAFLHQIVYDPIQRKQVLLNPISDDVDYDQLRFAEQYGKNNKTLNKISSFFRCDYTSLAFQYEIGNLNVERLSLNSVLFSLTSTQINQQTFSTPSSSRKIRSKSGS